MNVFTSGSLFLIKMKFRFCGDADCPDWVLAEINMLSKLSSIKVKLLAQVVAHGIITPPIDMEKAEKLFVDTKLDANVNLKACIACLTYIITSAVRYNCDHNALHSELQQLGLPKEHSTSIKRVADDQCSEISGKLRTMSLKVNALDKFTVEVDKDAKCAILNLSVGDERSSVVMMPYTIDVLLENLKSVKNTMKELSDTPYTI